MLRLSPRGADSPSEDWAASETALLICDVWDQHWCPTASARVAELAPAVDAAARTARSAGVLIVHAPANCMAAYADTPQRRAAAEAPAATPPRPLVTTERFGTTWCWPDPEEGPLPIDDTDGGCDCQTTAVVDSQVWSREHPAIELHGADAVTESGVELYNLLVHRAVTRVLVCGVHLNMCVLGRGYGIRQLLRLGFHVRLVRDLTDAMYSVSLGRRAILGLLTYVADGRLCVCVCVCVRVSVRAPRRTAHRVQLRRSSTTLQELLLWSATLRSGSARPSSPPTSPRSRPFDSASSRWRRWRRRRRG
jgi:nicotinamidase-related amidase